ncbi:hypothetical protein [Pedobacter sp.]|uniref:hypothetical protein n=1 Tax=Pedobacter sp. TaxID=1411316 RepID=UPI003BAD7160
MLTDNTPKSNIHQDSPLVIIDATYYSDGFPKENWEELIPRSNYISQIEDDGAENIKLLFIEGEEDAGKSTLLAQFVKKNVETSISVFFNPLNDFDYNLDYYCTNVVLQISHLLGDEIPYENTLLISTEQYLQSLYQFRKFLKKRKNHINLLVDGLESKLIENPNFVRELFQIIPFGEEFFRIIISGNRQKYLDIYPKLIRQESKSIILSGFSDDQAIKFLDLKNAENNIIGDLYKITKGYPGRLKTLKRILKSEGYSLDRISKHTTYSTWLELDCDSINLRNPEINAIISLLTLSQQSFSPQDIAQITSIEINIVMDIIAKIGILEKSDKYIKIASNAHKKYLKNLLRGNKGKIEELLISYYAQNETLTSLIELPRLYCERKEWPKVIELLDDKYLSKILERTGSIQIVNDTLLLGVEAADKANRSSDLLRYSLQGSIVNELDNYLFWESEIEARISIKDFIGAVSLAESAVLLVDRLRLLALIARRQKELFDKVDEVLANLIQELYYQIDISSVGNKIYDIVTHLIYAIPNLAIEIIEKSSGKVSDKNINSWVMAKLSIAAIESGDKSDNGNYRRKIEAIERLNPPAFRQVSQAIAFLVGNYDSERVLSEVNKISDRDEKLKLLRLWLNNSKASSGNIDEVISKALDEMIATTSETSITIEVLNELSSRLPYIENEVARIKLYKRFKSVENDLSDLGMVKDKFVYQLNMFHTEFLIFKDTSIHSLNKILNDIESVQDILIQLESFAEAFDKLTLMNEWGLKPKVNFIYSRIITLSEKLFETTASQYKVSEEFLKTIAKRNPKLSLLIISKINNLAYREEGRALALDSYLENEFDQISTDILHDFDLAFETRASQQKFYLDVVERYSEADFLSYSDILKLLHYYEKISKLTDVKQRILGFTFFYKIVIKDQEWKAKKAVKIETQIYNNWKGIEADWDKIDEGFRLCYELAKDNTQLAKKIFDESEQLKKDSWLDSRLVAYTYLNSIKVVIRAFNGLMCSQSDTHDDYRIIHDLIARVPSQIEALRLWAEIGFFANRADREDILKRVVNDHIIIITHELVNSNINIENVTSVLTLIHLSNPSLAYKYINKLDRETKEMVLDSICYFYITKRNPFDFYESNVSKYTCTFSELSKAIEVLSKIETDNVIYFLIGHISKAIYADRDLSKPQISTLLTDLQAIVNVKFPDLKNIKHEGYKVVSELAISRIDRYSSKTPLFWENFLKRANDVPNLSDTIYIQSVLLDEIPFEKIPSSNLKKQLFEQITFRLKELPAHYEFVQRVTDISETMYQCDKTTWKKFVEEAFDLSKNLIAGSDVYKSQKNIIDSMYRIDPTFAKHLIKRIDQDNHSNKINNLLNKHYETLEVANKIKNSKTLIQKEKENAHSVVNGVFIALKALNTEKISPKKITEISNYLNLGNKLPLHEAFPIYMYYLNNCSKIYRSSTEKSILNIHRENFREAVNATNLIQILSQRKKGSEKSFRQFFIDEEFSSNKPIKPKSREQTFNFIKNWILENVEEFIIIADPFFEKQDLELLKIINEIDVSVDVDILGSKDYFISDVEDEYRNYWKSICDEEPPFVNVTFCRTQSSSEPPFHDRWIITKNSGLRIGTSVNSVGYKKDSEISVMKPNEALRIREDTLNEYITRRKKEFNNERLYYKSFSL